MAKRASRRARDEQETFGQAADPSRRKWTRKVQPRTPAQSSLMREIDTQDVVFAIGPAGSGKTYLAVSKAAEALQEQTVRRIILTRPAVESGERLGFLPGDLRDKLDPYMRPLYDALIDRMSPKEMRTFLDNGTIEIAPLAFMRGRTFNDSFIILDEAQNCTRGQIKMALTRLGHNSRMVVTGDPDQSDLPDGDSGLAEVASALEGTVSGIAVCRLGAEDIVRHRLVSEMVARL